MDAAGSCLIVASPLSVMRPVKVACPLGTVYSAPVVPPTPVPAMVMGSAEVTVPWKPRLAPLATVVPAPAAEPPSAALLAATSDPASTEVVPV